MCLYCRKCVTCFTYCRCRCTYLFTLLIYLCTNEGEQAAFQGEAPPAPAPGTGATRGPCVRSIISSLTGENLTPEHPVVHSAFLRPPLNTPTLMRLLPDPLGASRAGGGSCSRPGCAPTKPGCHLCLLRPLSQSPPPGPGTSGRQCWGPESPRSQKREGALSPVRRGGRWHGVIRAGSPKPRDAGGGRLRFYFASSAFVVVSSCARMFYYTHTDMCTHIPSLA